MKYNVIDSGSRQILNLDGPLSREDADRLASEIESDNDLECELKEDENDDSTNDTRRNSE